MNNPIEIQSETARYYAYELKSGDFLVPENCDGKQIILRNNSGFKITEYYSAKLKTEQKTSDTGMVHDDEREFDDFVGKELIARKAHFAFDKEVYLVRTKDGDFEYFTEDEINIDTNIKLNSNWEIL